MCHEHGGHHHTHQPVKNEPRVFVNPEILDPAEDMNTYQEGCLSVPDSYADVDRPKACRVRWQDLDGTVHEEAMEGLMATCIQHEMDHLEGKLFVDYLSELKRTRIRKKLEKEPLYSIQGHAIYYTRFGLWAAVDVTYYGGGRTTVDGERGEEPQNLRVGGTLAIPITQYHSVKLYASTGAVARVGGNFTTAGIAWQFRWGGGL